MSKNYIFYMNDEGELSDGLAFLVLIIIILIIYALLSSFTIFSHQKMNLCELGVLEWQEITHEPKYECDETTAKQGIIQEKCSYIKIKEKTCPSDIKVWVIE